MGLVLRSLAYHFGFYFGTFCLAILGLPAMAGPPAWSRWMGTVWGRFVIGWARLTVGIRYRLVGAFPPGPIIIAAKHQSAFETFLLPAHLPDALFVLKRELLRAPVVGWYLRRAGQIALDRSGGGSAMRQLLQEAEGIVSQGLSLIIFPEGTRVAAGETAEIQPGVTALYRRLGVPVVPVSLDSGQYWPRKSFLRRPGTITVRVHAPIEPGLGRPAFEAALARAINTEVGS